MEKSQDQLSNLKAIAIQIRKSKFWWVSATILILLFVIGFSLSAFANPARPGDLLFGIDRGFEKLRIGTTLSSDAKFKYKVNFTQERIEELLSFDVNDTSRILESLNELDRALVEVDNCIDKINELENSKQTAHDIIGNLQELIIRYRDFLNGSDDDTEKIQQKLDESIEQIQTLTNQANPVPSSNITTNPQSTVPTTTPAPKFETVTGSDGNLIEVEFEKVLLNKNEVGEYTFSQGTAQYIIVSDDNLEYALNQVVSLHGWQGTNNSIFLTELEVSD
jgi:hypothetical protein